MFLKKSMAIAAVVAAGMTFVATPAFASASSTSNGETVVVGGRTFGPEDGVETTTESYTITPGSGETVGSQYPTDPVPGKFQTKATWGASYATSDEYVQYFYRGKAKAAANVYSGKRIIKVCIQYTRNGKGVADKRCSSATSNGSSWTAGPETTSNATDATYVSGPRTIFNISTTRVDPGIR